MTWSPGMRCWRKPLAYRLRLDEAEILGALGQVGGWQHPKEGWDVEANGEQTVTPSVPGCTTPPSALLCHPQGHAHPTFFPLLFLAPTQGILSPYIELGLTCWSQQHEQPSPLLPALTKKSRGIHQWSTPPTRSYRSQPQILAHGPTSWKGPAN